jgi:hypothetical protein
VLAPVMTKTLVGCRLGMVAERRRRKRAGALAAVARGHRQ